MRLSLLVCTCLIYLGLNVLWAQDPSFYWGYSLSEPDQTLHLPEELEEISGLSLDASQQYLVAIQDEDGLIFYLDRQSGVVIRQFEFWKDGDYEGVEVVGDQVFVVKNTGTIYQVSNPGAENQEVEKINQFLTSDNDVEGLAYDPVSGHLLLACKEQPGESFASEEIKAIYSYNIQEKLLEPLPLILLRRSAVLQYLSFCQPGPNHEKICEIFAAEKESFEFSPSAIAIHPLTNHVYITSSQGKLLIVMNRQGEILHIDKLPKKIHRQPEGLCFDAAGNLYISNEQKKDDPPTIYYFTYDPNRNSGR